MNDSSKQHGILLSLGSNTAFIVLAIVIALAAPMGSITIGSLRVIGTFPLLLILLLLNSPDEARSLLKLNTKEWCLSILTATLLGLNIWLFAAAPLWGEAEGVAQGYLFLPICLAALDLLRGEPITKLLLSGVILASIGIAHSILSAPHLSWVALFIGISMALYFDIHKNRHLSLLQRIVSDFGLLTPFCIAGLAIYGNWSIISTHWYLAIGLAILTTLGYLCYLGASKALSHTIFGILSLLEPVGLSVIAVLLYYKSVSYLDIALMLLGAILVSIPTENTKHS